MIPTQETPVETVDFLESPPKGKLSQVLHWGGWGLLSIFCLLFFTLLKMPDDKIKDYLNGSINAALASKGIELSASESKLSYFIIPTYWLKDVTLRVPQQASSHIDEIQISPSILPMMFGKLSGTLKLLNGNGKLRSHFSFKNESLSLHFRATELDVGKVALLPILLGIQGSGIVNGKGSLSGELSHPNSLDGDLKLQASKFNFEPQSLAGFSLPRIHISDSLIEMAIEKSKLDIKSFKLGKPSDDLQATVTGDVLLGPSWNTSKMNLKVQFSLSESVKKSLILLDTLLGPGKQADGSYLYSLTGSPLSPMPMAISATPPPNGNANESGSGSGK